MGNKKPMVIHPFAFAIFPVLFLYSHNVNEVFLRWTVVPTAIVLVCTFLLFVVLSYLCRHKDKAGVLVSLLLVYFFAYGHFVGTIRELADGWREAHLWLLPVWTVCFVVSGWLVLRTGMRLINTTKILNVIAICLVGFSLINIVRFEIRAAGLREGASVEPAEELSSVSKVPQVRPNIYYIILDAYAGNDVLKESLDYDNSSFLEQLAQRGFFVAGQSRTNYVKTILSLPSSLNFEYLDDLAKRVGVESGDRRPLRERMVSNRVFNFLRRHDYTTVAFPSGFHLTELRDADVYMSPGVWSLNDFSGELVYNTPVAALVELFTNQHFKHILHRRRILYSFNHLADTVKMEPPIFVFAHVACPHIPFVLDEEGRAVSGAKSHEEFPAMYVAQVKYVNKRVIEVVDSLLANSAQRPIIILQADHGVRWRLQEGQPERNTSQIYKECFSILNAYYLPDCDYSQLYEAISPVNTFRVILNHYFGTEFELLKDESYFSTKAQPYNFVNVTAELNKQPK